MKRIKYLALGLAVMTVSMTALASDDGCKRFRVDCRFYEASSPHFCYASAIYNVQGIAISEVKYGVGCDFQTIFNDSGIIAPQQTVSDGIRPRTAATPRVELMPSGSLRQPGTYTSKLETSDGKFEDGVCYVRELRPDEVGYGPLL